MSPLTITVMLAALAVAPHVQLPSEPEQARQAVERGLAFLDKDAAKWRKERECSTCHHGTMTLWALNEAKSQGYGVRAETVTDVARWTKDRWVSAALDKPRDPRPGWNLLSLPTLYLTMMAQAVPGQDSISRDDLTRMAGHIVRHQEADGSWITPPPRNGAPPVFESPEVFTLLAYLALGAPVVADAKLPSPAAESRQKATDWLSKTKAADTTQVAALRLLVAARAGQAPKVLQVSMDGLLARQNADGGWGQLKDLPSDAYATGQAVYLLRLAGMPADRREIQRAVSFLVANQKPDGSWPMTPRAQPGQKPARNPVPIIHFGSAWATLGLARCVPK